MGFQKWNFYCKVYIFCSWECSSCQKLLGVAVFCCQFVFCKTTPDVRGIKSIKWTNKRRDIWNDVLRMKSFEVKSWSKSWVEAKSWPFCNLKATIKSFFTVDVVFLFYHYYLSLGPNRLKIFQIDVEITYLDVLVNVWN